MVGALGSVAEVALVGQDMELIPYGRESAEEMVDGPGCDGVAPGI